MSCLATQVTCPLLHWHSHCGGGGGIGEWEVSLPTIQSGPHPCLQGSGIYLGPHPPQGPVTYPSLHPKSILAMGFLTQRCEESACQWICMRLNLSQEHALGKGPLPIDSPFTLSPPTSFAALLVGTQAIGKCPDSPVGLTQLQVSCHHSPAAPCYPDSTLTFHTALSISKTLHSLYQESGSRVLSPG